MRTESTQIIARMIIRNTGAQLSRRPFTLLSIYMCSGHYWKKMHFLECGMENDDRGKEEKEVKRWIRKI